MYWVPVTVANVGIICGRLVGEGVNVGIVVASTVRRGVFDAEIVGLGVFVATYSRRAVLVGGIVGAVFSAVGDCPTATAEAISVGVGLLAPFA